MRAFASVGLLALVIAPTAAFAATDCSGPLVQQPLALPATAVAPVASELGSRTSQLGMPSGVLAQAPDVSQSLDHVLLRLRISNCRDIAKALPAAPVTVATAATAPGRPAEFHSERFTAAPIVDGRAFTVQLTESGLAVDVAADESALAAIRRVKPDVQYSCQQGFCGACRVRLVDGVVEHRDRVLTPDQHDDSMMICVSRAQGDSISVAL